MKTTKKITLPEDEIPRQWYNILADMPNQPQPLLNPQTREPLTKEDMEQLFAKELVAQEFSKERYIDIPDEVRTLLKSTALPHLYAPADWRRPLTPLPRSTSRTRASAR
jgi:tryptophan synthase beta chain